MLNKSHHVNLRFPQTHSTRAPKVCARKCRRVIHEVTQPHRYPICVFIPETYIILCYEYSLRKLLLPTLDKAVHVCIFHKYNFYQFTPWQKWKQNISVCADTQVRKSPKEDLSGLGWLSNIYSFSCSQLMYSIDIRIRILTIMLLLDVIVIWYWSLC